MQDAVAKAKAGDLEAFGALVDRYKDMAYGASYAILGNFHDAQDTTQEAFVKAWQKLDTLKDCGGFPSWLCRITRNVALDRLRRTHGPTESIEGMMETLAAPRDKDPRERAEQHELHEAVLAAIRSLSEPNRLATALFYINGYSIEEVAEFLEVPAGTVKRRLHESRTQLRERMVDMVEDVLKSQPLPPDWARETLHKIGDFVCLEKIGAGRMGSVYVAEHPSLKRKVAVKILADRGPGPKNYVKTAFVSLGKLDHPGFLKGYSMGEHEGRPYLVAEFVEDGAPLWTWLKKHGPCEPSEALQVMTQLAEAVRHAHDRDVVVGCINPMSILMRSTGSPVLCNVGPVQASAYRAPEWVNGEAPGKASDIWSLGVVMYELLTGRPLFDAETDEEKLQAISAPEPVDLAALKGRTPAYVVAVLERCLQKDPSARFSSAAELLQALKDAQLLSQEPPA